MEDSDDDDIPPIRIIKKKQKKTKTPKKKTAIQNAKEKFSELFEIFLTDIENANDEKKLLIEFGNYIKEKLIAEKPAIFKSLAIVPDPPKKSKRKKKKLSFSKFFIYYNNIIETKFIHFRSYKKFTIDQITAAIFNPDIIQKEKGKKTKKG